MLGIGNCYRCVDDIVGVVDYEGYLFGGDF